MPQETNPATQAVVVAPSAPSAAVDLSKELDSVLEKQAGETVRCVRVFGDHYRCNWWARQDGPGTPRPNGADLLVTAMRVRRSRFLKARKTNDGLVIEGLPPKIP